MTLSCDVTSSAQRRDKILFNDRISSLVVVEDGSTVSLSLLSTDVGLVLLRNERDVGLLLLLGNATIVGMLPVLLVGDTSEVGTLSLLGDATEVGTILLLGSDTDVGLLTSVVEHSLISRGLWKKGKYY